MKRRIGDTAKASTSERTGAVEEPNSLQAFKQLTSLVGEWKGEGEKGESAVATYTYAENQNFLVSSFATTLNGTPIVGGTQWIGWDPASLPSSREIAWW